MLQTQSSNLRLRRSFGKIKKIIDIPNLIEIQKRSYDEFLQAGVSAEQRTDTGLQAVFKSVFPIKDFNETASLEFVGYELGEPKYDVDECHQRGMTYAAPLKVKIQLVIWDVESGRRSIKNVKEQEVYFGEIPLMTPNGTFMVNGTERVIVSQLHRSPGVFFEHDKGRTHSTGKLLYSARVIPYRGSWIDFEFDPKDVLFVRIDRRRKFPATVLLRALGMTTEDLLNYYYRKDVILLSGKLYAKQFKPDQLLGARVSREVKDPKSGEVIAREGRKFNKAIVRQMEQAKISEVPIGLDEVVSRISAHDVPDPETGEVLLKINEELSEEILEKLRERGIKKIEVLYTEGEPGGGPLRLTLAQDKLGRARGSGGGNLPAASSGRSADQGNRHHFFQQPVFQPGALRSLQGRAAQAQPQAQDRRAAGAGHAAPRGYPRSRALPARAQERQRPGRRYRPSGQPARARGRRAGREPVPNRPGADGARDQGADEPAGYRNPDAAGAGELQAGVGGDQGVLRLLAAFAVHGSDQPAERDRAQAPAFGAGTGRA